MKHYTDTIPLPLAEKLKEKGMPMEKEGENTWCPPYAEVFDWLMEKGIVICFDIGMDKWIVYIIWMTENHISNCAYLRDCSTWHEAAVAAIECALELILGRGASNLSGDSSQDHAPSLARDEGKI